MTPKEANERRFAEMSDSEIQDLVDRSTAYAVRMIADKSWRTGKGGYLPGGRTANDLVQAALENFLNGGKWDDGKPLWLVMQGFISGCVGNFAKSVENRKFSNPGDDEAVWDKIWSSAVENGADEAETDRDEPDPEDENRILEIVDGLKDGSSEKRIANSFLNGASKRAEVLAETGLKAAEYEAAKKRLRRFLKEFRQEPAPRRH